MIAGAIFISCGKMGTDEASSYGASSLRGLSSTSEVTFSMIYDNVLGPQCVSCHTSFTSAENISESLVAGHPEKSSLYLKILSGEMPKNKPALSAIKADLVKRYVVGLIQNP